MTNLLNSLTIQNNNAIAARKLSKDKNERPFVEAPQSLPKYSIDKVLEEKRNFKETIEIQQNKLMKKNKNRNIVPKLFSLIGALGFYFLLTKK